MEQGQALLQIHLALQELQITQKQILARLDEDKESHADIDRRLSSMETNWTYLLGAAAPLGIVFYFVLDWLKTKLGITA